MRHQIRNLVHIVSCENLLAVLFKDNFEGHKVFLYNGENETWLPYLDISAVTGPWCYPLDIAICRNLLAITVLFPAASVEGEEKKTFFWQLNASQPADTSPQCVGAVSYPNIRQSVSVLLNEKWIGAWRIFEKEILIIEQAKLFDQNQIAVEAQKVDPAQPLSPWRLMILNDLDYYRVSYVSLEPSISNHLAVKALSPCTSRFRILNLATREIICQISMDIMDLHPVSWWAGNILFLRIRPQRRFDTEQEIQVMVFDPSGCKFPQAVEQLEQGATYLLPGPTFQYSGAAKLPFSVLSMNQIDWFGIVLAESSTLFIASVD